VAQLGATIGRTFAYELLQGVTLGEATLQQGLRQLSRSSWLPAGGATTGDLHVQHALIQQAAYQSLPRSTRQPGPSAHWRGLKSRFPALVETQLSCCPALHCSRLHRAGGVYWQRAAQHASEPLGQSGSHQPLHHRDRAAQTLPETPERAQHALTMYPRLGAALQMTKGLAAPEVEHAYTQAHTLCQQVGETPELIPVLHGLWRYYNARCSMHTRESSAKRAALGATCDDPALTVVAPPCPRVYVVLTWCVAAARQHLEEGIAHYTPDQRRTPASASAKIWVLPAKPMAAWSLWLLGYPDQALARSTRPDVGARAVASYSLAFARCWAAIVSQFRRDVSAVHEHAEAAIALATEHGLCTSGPPWERACTGWALAMQGQGRGGDGTGPPGGASWRTTGHVHVHLVHLAGGSL